jgi:hypothetical protein
VGERGQRRRRLHEQRRLREALLLDLGALVYELHRQGRRAPELLQQKAAELTVVDEEVRELEAELDGRAPVGATDATAEVDAVDDPELGEEDEPEEGEPGEGEEPPAGYEEEPAEAVAEHEEDEDDVREHEHADEHEHDDALAEHDEPRA